MALIWPNGSTSIPRVTSEFNPNRKHPITRKVRPHRGIDLAGPKGRPQDWTVIVAPTSGVVTTNSFESGSAGNYVNIRADDGSVLKFFHLKHRSGLRVGQRIGRGDVIGVMGESGGAKGVHLHFETWVGGQAINPRTYYSQRQLHAEAAPIPQEDDMPYTEKQLQQIAANGVAQALEGKQATNRLRSIVWGRTVKRGRQEIPAIQELADTKTAQIETNAKLDRIIALLEDKA